MEKKETKMQIPKITLDDLFSTQEQRDNANLEKVIEVNLTDITDFPNHPFKVKDDDEMEKMRQSVEENGVVHSILEEKEQVNLQIKILYLVLLENYQMMRLL